MASFLHRSSDIEHAERRSREKISPCPKYKNCNFCNGVGTGASRFKNELDTEHSSDSDCEVMEREQWEKVSAKRKRHRPVFNHQFYHGDGIYFNFIPEKENSFKDSNQKFEQGEKTSKEKVSPCPKCKNCDFCNGVSSTGASRFKKELDGEEGEEEPKFMRQCNGVSFSFDEKHVNATDDFGLHAKYGDDDAKERDIINEREKLKETDEYKHAMEEEWASRQRQMQIQAKEAQRLRKGKKAESEMQRRQKERIEEVRETQKKDEEFIKVKEQLRAEIQKELKELEMRCNNMTSLLRCLGIHVGGPNEVHAAYKQALLKFHPDRASKTDIREQVEAEEKFKLILRMKQKFLLTK